MTTPMHPTHRFLILDDDPLVGQTMQFIAEDLGLETRLTNSPADFFEALEFWAPTHIAVDLIMPDMDGVQVMKQLADNGCKARLIITSGVGARVLDAAGRSAIERGLDIVGVLSKPFTAGELRRLLVGSTAPAPAGSSPATTAAAAPGLDIDLADIRQGLSRREFRVVYQPKIACESGLLSGFEALVRWVHPDYGPIWPASFIQLAEEHGLIDALTEQVLDLALEWFAPLCSEATRHPVAALSAAAGIDLSLSVNISAKTLNDLDLIDRLVERCTRLQLAPARLIFELTETSAMDNPMASLDLLTRLRMKGFHLSIDDFGTGFSSLLQLVRLPFSEIKVDKSFVMTAMHSEESRTVVKSIVDLGRSLGLRTVAEGVETAEVLGFLGNIGCHLAQGFHIARPMTGEATLRWMGERYGVT
ncbi:MAG: EAL domain-containing response regulator [Proteobacteria bacterium]|nr:EAL domain-containing response regulator [Pseudomonadota bacterium]